MVVGELFSRLPVMEKKFVLIVLMKREIGCRTIPFMIMTILIKGSRKMELEKLKNLL